MLLPFRTWALLIGVVHAASKGTGGLLRKIPGMKRLSPGVTRTFIRTPRTLSRSPGEQFRHVKCRRLAKNMLRRARLHDSPADEDYNFVGK